MKPALAYIGTTLTTAVILIGCGRTSKTGITPPASSDVIESAPAWYLNPPKDDDFIFTTGTSTSRDMQFARDKAVESARFEAAKIVETRFEALSKRFQEEVGTSLDAQYLDQFTQATKSTVSEVLAGVSVDKTSLLVESGVFRAFALVKFPVGASSEALLNKLKQQDELYTRFRSSQVFDELDKQSQKFQEWKKTQNQ